MSATDLYERALESTPAKVVPRLAGAVSDGYWIDDQRYFYSVGVVDAAGRRAVPMIADVVARTSQPVLELGRIAELLSAQKGSPVALVDLAYASYDMPTAMTLVVTLGTEAYHLDAKEASIVKVETIDPTLALYSPDGKFACFLKGHAVWMRKRGNGHGQPLTDVGEPHYAFGRLIESGVAPLSTQKHAMPVGLWSADSQWFATLRIDERALPEGGLVEHAPDGGGPPIAHRFKVCRPEDELPTLELLVIHAASGRTLTTASRPMNTALFTPFDLRACWFVGDRFYFLDFDRYRAKVSLVEMSLDTGALRTLLSEEAQSGWIDPHPFLAGQPMVRALRGSNEVIWYSEREGFGHLYLHDLNTGVLKNRITQGNWMVRELVHVDAAKWLVYFLANTPESEGDPSLRRLCAIGLDGRDFKVLYEFDGDVSVRPDPQTPTDATRPFRPSYSRHGVTADGRFAAAKLSHADAPTRTVVLDLSTGKEFVLAEITVDPPLRAPRPFDALAADGATRLYGAMFLPPGFDERKCYPLVDYIYPGPQANWFVRRFPNAMALTAQAVADLGMVVIMIESRGMPNRSRSFHQDGTGNLYQPPLSDHVAVIEQLCERHRFLDRDRVGIFGQSGGGYATARAMFEHPDLFKVGVSVCGNHDSRHYATLWLDKYADRPGRPGREQQANAAAAHKLQGKLLLIHGDMDENVHIGHTLALADALVKAGKPFDLLVVPGATHSVMFESSYAMTRLMEYLAQALLQAPPARQYGPAYSPVDFGTAMQFLVSDMAWS